MMYISWLENLLDIKIRYTMPDMILHTDPESVYSTKSFNGLLPVSNIIKSMYTAGTPIGNGSMLAINGWIKAEIISNLDLMCIENVTEQHTTIINAVPNIYWLAYLSIYLVNTVQCNAILATNYNTQNTFLTDCPVKKVYVTFLKKIGLDVLLRLAKLNNTVNMAITLYSGFFAASANWLLYSFA